VFSSSHKRRFSDEKEIITWSGQHFDWKEHEVIADIWKVEAPFWSGSTSGRESPRCQLPGM